MVQLNVFVLLKITQIDGEGIVDNRHWSNTDSKTLMNKNYSMNKNYFDFNQGSLNPKKGHI